MLTVRWGFCPNEVRLAIRPLLVQYLWLVPGWCRLLQVGFATDDPDHHGAQAVTSASVEYRFGKIIFLPDFISSSATERRLTVIHELLHIPAAPPTLEHERSLDTLFEDGEAPKFHATLQGDWTRALEGMVQDLTYSILRIAPEHLPPCAFMEEEDEPPALSVASSAA